MKALVHIYKPSKSFVSLPQISCWCRCTKKRDADNFLDRVSLQCFVWPVENSAALVHKGLWRQDWWSERLGVPPSKVHPGAFGGQRREDHQEDPSFFGSVPGTIWLHSEAAPHPYSSARTWSERETSMFDYSVWQLRQTWVLINTSPVFVRRVFSGFASWDESLAH